jgi:hypothetical protein
MNLDHHSANTSRYAPTSLRARLAMALVAVVCSSVVLGTALGLFELQARTGMAAQVGNWPALGRGTFVVCTSLCDLNSTSRRFI